MTDPIAADTPSEPADQASTTDQQPTDQQPSSQPEASAWRSRLGVAAASAALLAVGGLGGFALGHAAAAPGHDLRPTGFHQGPARGPHGPEGPHHADPTWRGLGPRDGGAMPPAPPVSSR